MAIKDFKVLILISDRYYITAIRNVIKKVTENINLCLNIDEAFNELSHFEYNFFIVDYILFTKDFSVKSFSDAFPNTDLIIVTPTPSYSQESMTIRQGAKDYIDLNSDINLLPNKLTSLYNDKKDHIKIKEHLLNNFMLESNNESFNKMLSQCEKVAKSKANILLTGESGTGKEVAAKYIHICSSRCTSNFVAVNCSSYTESLLESELFGYEQGSFTGAVKSKEGKFELANNGTLFLDEVGEINLSTQVKLLRVLETKKVERLGSNKEKLMDFKLISATNRDLVSQVVKENFREDFFYRISSIVIHVPSLRDRKEDLNLLIKYFLEISQKENDIEIKHIEPEALKFLQEYGYPGNIRELKSIIDRMVVLSSDGVINKDGIPILFNIYKKSNVTKNVSLEGNRFNRVIPFKDFKSETETEYLQWVLLQTGGNVAEAARQLGISSRQLFNKIREYDLKK
ncbi:MAG: sigma 54-interacting transcriptional regulator [Sedimentibacter sp.]